MKRRGTPVGDASTVPRRRSALLPALAIVVVAVNLRPAVAGVGPVLPDLRAGLPLSGAAAGVLTTLPVLCFGLLATAAPRLARRFGAERVLLGATAVLTAGLLLRPLDVPGVGHLPALLAGTAGCAAMTCQTDAGWMIGAKSRSGLKGSFSYSNGLIAMIGCDAYSRV